MMRPHFALGSVLRSNRMIARIIFAAIIVAAVGQIVSAGSAFAASVDQAARALLPVEIRDKGVLTAAMPLDFEPYNFLDEKNEQVGLDVEVFRAVAETLGLKPDIQRLGFASVISAVSGGRVDVAMSSMGIIESRLKQVSFVRYALLTNGLIVRKGNPTNVSNKDACGHSIALEKGTQPVFVWEEKSKECEAAHKPKIEIMIFDGKGPQVLAVETGPPGCWRQLRHLDRVGKSFQRKARRRPRRPGTRRTGRCRYRLQEGEPPVGPSYGGRAEGAGREWHRRKDLREMGSWSSGREPRYRRIVLALCDRTCAGPRNAAQVRHDSAAAHQE